MENRGYVQLLRSLFPEQTRTLPRIIVWSIIFLIDLCVIIFGEFQLDLIPYFKYEGLLLAAITVGVFWLEGYIWGIFLKLFR